MKYKFYPDTTNIANLVTLENSFDDPKNILIISANSVKLSLEGTPSHPSLEALSNVATVLGDRYKSKSLSPNVINLTKHNFSEDDISLLFKVIPTP